MKNLPEADKLTGLFATKHDIVTNFQVVISKERFFCLVDFRIRRFSSRPWKTPIGMFGN